MISFIPKDKKGNAWSGVCAGGAALLVVCIGIPMLIYDTIRKLWQTRKRNV